jgi:hypothetical protein
MSTKIYTAWRFRQNKLNEFLQLARKSVFKKEYKWWTNSMYGISAEEEEEQLKKIERQKLKDLIRKKIARYFIVKNRIDNTIRESDKDPTKKTLLRESGFHFWLYKGYYYCIPWGQYTDNHFSSVKFPGWVENYSYWNNTDQPKNITNREWNNRRKMWDKVCLGRVIQWSEFRLEHVIFSWRDFMSFFYYTLEIEEVLGLKKYLD